MNKQTAKKLVNEELNGVLQYLTSYKFRGSQDKIETLIKYVAKKEAVSESLELLEKYNKAVIVQAYSLMGKTSSFRSFVSHINKSYKKTVANIEYIANLRNLEN